MTPRDQGYRAPADWEPQRRFWMAWPAPGVGLGEDDLEEARRTIAALARTIAELGPVTMLANPTEVAEVSLRCGPGVGTLTIPHSDCCVRSIGPTFLVDGQGGAAGIIWGASDLAARMLEQQSLPAFTGPPPPIGPGTVDVDGDGTCLAAESLLDGFGRAETEACLKDWLGVDTVLWLGAGLEDEPPPAKVVRVARFLRPGLVLALAGGDADDPNRPLLDDNLARLKQARDARGRRLSVIEAPQPRRRRRSGGRRLPMTYTDCFIGRDVVILPAFDDSRDQTAYDRVVGALLDANIIAFPAWDFPFGGGALGSLVLPQPDPAAEAGGAASR